MSCAHHTEFVKLEKAVLTNRPKSVLKKTVLTDRGDAPTVGTNTILQEQTFGLLLVWANGGDPQQWRRPTAAQLL
jgi:hypothetical protein